MSEAIAAPAVAALPPRRHRWDRWPLTPAASSRSGCEEHRRICIHCHVTVTTFIPPTNRYQDIYRRWTMPDGSVLGYGPPCVNQEQKHETETVTS